MSMTQQRKIENKKGLKVYTDQGFSDFDALAINGVSKTIKLVFEKTSLECTTDHEIYISKNKTKKAGQLMIGDDVLDDGVSQKVLNIIDINKTETVFDLLNVEKGNRFFANNVLVSNCEFLVYDETLIDSTKLSELESKTPVMNMGQTRWFKKPDPECTYAVALDPSMGTGGDYSAIEVFELPTYEQIAEWRANHTAIPGQIKVLRDICNYLVEQINNNFGVYWSVENNAIGESALIVIDEIGEENFGGIFISEPNRKGHVKKYRKGFNTTHGTKISACSTFKNIIEQNKMKIHSAPLISELKSFIATGSSYKAKQGKTDDLVSACLLIIRMVSILKEWDPKVYETFRTVDAEDDYEAPMPIFVSGS